MDYKILKGCSWSTLPKYSHCTYRYFNPRSTTMDYFGFRVICKKNE